MSADNWAVCPRCKKREMDASLELDRKAEAMFVVGFPDGQISIDDFLVLRQEAKDRREALPIFPATFREDYEIFGAEDGAIEVHYSGACKDCGLKLKFTDYRPLDV